MPALSAAAPARWAPRVIALAVCCASATVTSSSTTTGASAWNDTSFLRLGDGDCLAPASRPVRGVSQRDVDHGSCRAFCRGDACLGYAYAPCERICMVYGEAQLLLAGQDASGWSAINGWGSISHSTRRCGSACFLRMSPCYQGSVRSAGAVVAHGNLSFGVATEVPCQLPYKGSLQLMCGISGVEVISGRCLRQCPGGSYVDRSFEVFYPSSLHSEVTSSGCPRGAQGNITMRCYDGEALYTEGRCGYNCAPGSLRAGSGTLMYPAMSHQAEATMPCPPGWAGAPTVRCDDSFVRLVAGRCYRHCSAGAVPLQLGFAAGEVPHGPLNHSESLRTSCPPASFSGEVTLQCTDGAVSLNMSNFTCQRHCRPGNISSAGSPWDAISARRNVSHGQLAHGSLSTMGCQRGFFSYPTDTLYAIGDSDEILYKQPLKDLRPTGGIGVAVNEYKRVTSVAIADGFLYVVGSMDKLIYREALGEVSPTSFWHQAISSFEASSIAVAEGYIYGVGAHDERVYRHALDTLTPASSWQLIATQEKNITSVAVLGGVIYAAGKEEKQLFKKAQTTPFSMWDGPITGEYNFQIASIQVVDDTVYAVAYKKIYTQNMSTMNAASAWVGPASGEQQIRAIAMGLVDIDTAQGTWNPGFHGSLLVGCFDGDVNLLQGECRMHCAAGSVISNNVILGHANMSHGSMILLQCPSTHTGELRAFCEDGGVYFTGSCGLNCPSTVVNGTRNSTGVSYDTAGAVVQIPPLNHSDLGVWTNVSCPSPYAGGLTVRCFFGEHRIYGLCQAACQGATWGSNSAEVTYPALNHSQSYTGRCVARYPLLSYTGSVTFTCINGKVGDSGACYSDCTDGTFLDNNVKVNNGLVPSGSYADLTCEPDAMYGRLRVQCSRGNLLVTNGSCGMPCFEGRWSGAASRDREMLVPDMGHGGSLWATCPPELSGQLHMQCINKIRRVLGGSCGERCFGRPLQVYGANFNSPQLDHQATFEQLCMSPYDGKVLLNCTDGSLNVTSFCVQGCFAGSVTIPGGALVRYPDTISGERYATECPSGYAGFVTLQCGDLVPFVKSGACYKHCTADRFVGEGWDVEHNVIYHNDTQDLRCKDTFDGYVILKCMAGVVSLQEGTCHQRCANGRFNVRLGVTIRYEGLRHGEMTSSSACPDGYVGSVRLICRDGMVSIGEGGCPAHCTSGIEQGARYAGMLHLENSSLVCPVAGTLSVRCLDGVVTVLGGKCMNGCSPGTLLDSSGLPVEFGAVDHLGNVTGTCIQNATGYVQVNCTDTVAMLDPLPGQRCYKHCQPQVVNTSDGSMISSPAVGHGQQLPIECPAGLPGVVTVRCSSGVLTIASGQCGPMNCPSGVVTAGQTAVPHPMINDGMESDGPSACPGDYLGEATFSCSNGTTEVLNVSLRYPAVVGLEAVDFNQSNVSSAFLMQHEDEYFELCGCCIPSKLPPGADPIPGVDQRVIVVWAATVGGSGVLLAFLGGAWVMRPESFRRPKSASHVHAKEAVTEQELAQDDATSSDLVLQSQKTFILRQQNEGKVNAW